MGLITRENTEPITDTETGSANEMELEISKVFGVLNGNLDNDNFGSAAAIVGAKLKDGTVPGSALQNLTLTLTEIASTTLTTSNLATSAAMQCHESYDSSASATAMTTSSSFVDVEGITAWEVTPGSTSNYLFMTFTNSKIVVTGTSVYGYGFSVDGVETDTMAAQTVGGTIKRNTMRAIWAETAPRTTPIAVKPIYKLLSGTATDPVWGNRQFSAMLLPIK